MHRDIMLNVSRRWLMVQEVLGAGLVTGSDKIASGFGNGDCILVDLHNMVFAVADGTERHSRASRVFLERFRRALSDNRMPQGLAEWQELVQDLFNRQDYQCKTTFSMIALSRNAQQQGKAYIFNGGDSMVLMALRGHGTILYGSDVNMTFAGRSKNPGQVKEVTYEPMETRFVLASDGVHDILRPFNEGISGTLPSFLLEHNPAMIPGMIVERVYALGTRSRAHDDIGLLVIDTRYLHEAGKGCIIMGGTTPQQETRFRESITGKHGENLVQVGNPETADLYGGITVL